MWTEKARKAFAEKAICFGGRFSDLRQMYATISSYCKEPRLSRISGLIYNKIIILQKGKVYYSVSTYGLIWFDQA